MLSTHKAEVVPIVLTPHPNADTLSIVNVWGYTVCVRTSDWADKQFGVYITPDTLVDVSRPEFSFLSKPNGPSFHRVKVMKLRGIISQGLLVPVPDGFNVGDDCSEFFGLKRYEAIQEICNQTDNVSTHPMLCGISKYDLDSAYRYAKVFEEGEQVHLTEKLDGENARYVCIDGEMFVGSRNLWKKHDERHPHWIALSKHPELEQFCRDNPNMIVYGEVYGHNGKMPYSHEKKNIRFAAFDVFDLASKQYLSFSELVEQPLPHVPYLGSVPFNLQELILFADGPSMVPGANHIREGIVITPNKERWHESCGRVKLKIVSNKYLEKS